MDKMLKPVAASGLRQAGKIRAVIYAHNQLAHVPLAEILKLAVQAGQAENAADSRHYQAQAAAGQGYYLRLSGRLLVQYGFQAADKNGGRPEICFPLPFANADYYPFFSLCGAEGESAPAAFIAAESLRKTGFAVQSAPWAGPAAGSPAGPVPFARGRGVFWLAVGLAAGADITGEGDDNPSAFA